MLNLAPRSEGGRRNERPGWAEVIKRGFLEGCGEEGLKGSGDEVAGLRSTRARIKRPAKNLQERERRVSLDRGCGDPGFFDLSF